MNVRKRSTSAFPGTGSMKQEGLQKPNTPQKDMSGHKQTKGLSTSTTGKRKKTKYKNK